MIDSTKVYLTLDDIKEVLTFFIGKENNCSDISCEKCHHYESTDNKCYKF